MKIEAEIVEGCLVLKDPRRAGEHDREGEWMLLPAVDPYGIPRGPEPAIVRSHAATRPTTRHFGCIVVDAADPNTPIRDRRREAMRNLQELGRLRDALEELIAGNVEIARTLNSAYYDYGAPTWAEIGKALGVTKQAAQARYGRMGR